MKYIMIMQFPMAEWKTSHLGLWPSEDVKAHMDFLRRFNKDLLDAGEFVLTNGLAEPDQAKIVRATRDGAPAITDGPFPERAVQLAARASAAPGPGGKPLNMPIEVRPVMMHSLDGKV